MYELDKISLKVFDNKDTSQLTNITTYDVFIGNILKVL